MDCKDEESRLRAVIMKKFAAHPARVGNRVEHWDATQRTIRPDLGTH